MAKPVDIKACREAYEEDLTADLANREAAVDDLKFLAGGDDQWPDDVLRARRDDKRPIVTINRLPQFVAAVVGDVRQRPPSMKARPVDNGADIKVAEIYTGIMRDIEAKSSAETAYTKALEHAVSCGIGHFRIKTEYAEDDSFTQDIRIEPVYSPLGVVWDRGARDAVRRDARRCWVTQLLSKAEYERRYPKAAPADWDGIGAGPGQWVEGDFVRIAEYWWYEDEARTLLLLDDGSVIDGTDQAAAFDALQGRQVVRERKTTGKVVYQCIMSGTEQLTDTIKWAGRYIPVVPVLGLEVDVGERVVRKGLLRDAKHPQFLFNIHRTALVESIAMSTKAKWLGTAKQFAGLEQWWGAANVGNFAYLPYNPDAGAPPPQRIAPDMPAASLMQEIGLAAQDLEATTGIYRAALGAPSNETSGKAILARQREGDTATFTFPDNLARSVAHAGRILIDLIPKIYDTERVVRLLGEDGAAEMVTINTVGLDQMGRPKRINDLSVGKYDVEVSVGPSFTTKREEARESMLAFMQAYPPGAQIVGDIFAKYQDWPGSDEIAKRLRKALPPGLVEPEEGEPPPPPPPPPPELLKMQADMQIKQAEMQLDQQKAATDAQLKQQEMQAEQQRLAAEMQLRQLELAAAQQKMELERAKAAADLELKRLDLALREREMLMQAATAQQQREDGHMQREREHGQHGEMGAQIAEAVKGLQQVAAVMAAPKRIVYGADGRVAGAEPVMGNS